MVYGTTLRLPGEMINDNRVTGELDPNSYVTRLRTFMSKLQPTTSRDYARTEQIHPDLFSEVCVFGSRRAHQICSGTQNLSNKMNDTKVRDSQSNKDSPIELSLRLMFDSILGIHHTIFASRTQITKNPR